MKNGATNRSRAPSHRSGLLISPRSTARWRMATASARRSAEKSLRARIISSSWMAALISDGTVFSHGALLNCEMR